MRRRGVCVWGGGWCVSGDVCVDGGGGWGWWVCKCGWGQWGWVGWGGGGGCGVGTFDACPCMHAKLGVLGCLITPVHSLSSIELAFVWLSGYVRLVTLALYCLVIRLG